MSKKIRTAKGSSGHASKTDCLRTLPSSLMCEMESSEAIAVMLAGLSPVSPANPLVLLVNEMEKRTQDTSSLTSSTWLLQLVADSSFWKTLQESSLPSGLKEMAAKWTKVWTTAQTSLFSPLQSETYLESWPKAAFMRDGYLWPLKMLEHRTVGSDGGPSRGIPWATPNTMDYLPVRSGEAYLRQLHRGNMDEPARKQSSNLREQVIYGDPWPTPTENGNHNRAGLSEKSGDGIETAVKNWATPRAEDAESAGRRHNRDVSDTLNSQVKEGKNWPTPAAFTGGPDNQEQRDARGAGGEDIQAAVLRRENWLTPTANEDSYRLSGNSQQSKTLEVIVRPDGDKKSWRLNPDWEEILMAWEIGWTNPDEPCAGVWPGYPMGQGAEQHSYEPPRVIHKDDEKAMRDRTMRIRCVGNGVDRNCARAGFTKLLRYLIGA